MAKDPFDTNSKIEYGLTIDGTFYSAEKIKKMPFEQIKFLCAFCDEYTLRKLYCFVASQRALVYIDNLLYNC